MWGEALPLVLTASAALPLYSYYVAVPWLAAVAALQLLFTDAVTTALNSLAVSLVIFRAVFDRFRAAAIAALAALAPAKAVLLSEYYLGERLGAVYYLADGAFMALSAFMLCCHSFKPLKLREVSLLLVPAAALAPPQAAPISALSGSLMALADMPPYAALAVAAASACYLAAAGHAPAPLSPLALAVAYALTYRRVSHLSRAPPLGWLNAWLCGRYKVVRLLGVGGFSYVLAVKHGGAMYAAKVLRFSDESGLPLAGSEDVLRLFGHEMQRYLELKSEHVVRAHEVYLSAAGYKDLAQYMRSPPYILLEYMGGDSLRNLLRAGAPLPIGFVVEIFRQLARGLYDIHRSGIVHLDIKPENILLSRDMRVAKIGDMGIARAVSLGYVRISFMSPAYAAPEVRSGLASYASDIYSLGCVIYEALTGVNPNALAAAGHRIPPPSAYNPEVPGWLDEILLRMLDREPARRPSAGELLMLLSNVCADSSAVEVPSVRHGECRRDDELHNLRRVQARGRDEKSDAGAGRAGGGHSRSARH
jgi:hypothetical protein